MSYKQHLSRTSPFVVKQFENLIKPFYSRLEEGSYYLHVLPYHNPKLFWKLHKVAPQELVKAITNLLPDNYKFIDYDHLSNTVHVEVS